MPLVGLKAVIVIGAVLDMVLGVWLVVREHKLRPDPQVKKLVRSTTIATATVTAIALGVFEVDPRVLAAGGVSPGAPSRCTRTTACACTSTVARRR